MSSAAPRRVTDRSIQRDGATKSRTFRIPLWTLRLGVVVVVGRGRGLLVVVALLRADRAGGGAGAGARARGRPARSGERQVRELPRRSTAWSQRYAQVRQMIGADIVRDPVTARRRPCRSRRRSVRASPPQPRQLPTGRARVAAPLAAGRSRLHHPRPGRDRRSRRSPSRHRYRRAGRESGARLGRGHRRQTGEDPEYGLFVLLDHPDEYQTMYGHLSRIVVTVRGPQWRRARSSGSAATPAVDRAAPALRDPPARALARSANDGEGGTLMGIFSNPARDEAGQRAQAAPHRPDTLLDRRQRHDRHRRSRDRGRRADRRPGARNRPGRRPGAGRAQGAVDRGRPGYPGGGHRRAR